MRVIEGDDGLLIDYIIAVITQTFLLLFAHDFLKRRKKNAMPSNRDSPDCSLPDTTTHAVRHLEKGLGSEEE